MAPAGGLTQEFHTMFGSSSFDVTDLDCIITLSGIHNLPQRLFNPLGERSWPSPAGNGSTPAPAPLGILILRSFSLSALISVPMEFYITVAIFCPALDAPILYLAAPVGVVTCLYIQLVITTQTGFLPHLTTSSRLRFNTVHSCQKICHIPFPLRRAHCPKFSSQNSELQS